MFTRQDLANAQNMLKLVAKAKMELEGAEVFAAAEAMRWLSAMVKNIEADVNRPPEPPKPQPAPVEDVKIEAAPKPSKRK